jgi:hypothetical protein
MSSGTTDHQITVGVFADEARARQAVRRLEASGFDTTHLNVIADTEQQDNEAGNISDNSVTRSNSGLVAGALIGLLAGIMIGSVVVSGLVHLPDFLSGFGRFTLFVLIALVCAAFGILLGSMTGLGIAREGTVGLAKQVEAGRWLLSVDHMDSERARAALKEAGAIELRVQSDEAVAMK